MKLFLKAAFKIIANQICKIFLIILLLIAGFVLIICAMISIKLYDYAQHKITTTLTNRFVKPVLVTINNGI